MLKSIFLILLLALGALAQQQPQPKTHTIRGTIKDPNGAVIAGLHLLVDGERINWNRTDINGEFSIDLTVGDHVLTIDSSALYPFRAFLKISDGGPNPDNVGFVVDTSKVCCSDAAGRLFAKPISLPKPVYPPAARAVRANGEVVVAIRINADGNVASAQALNGHPLLRAAALAAARGARFEQPVNGAQSVDQEIRLTYLFRFDVDKARDGLSRYTNQYQIEVISTFGTF